jgi:peptidyl-prolyl cis-trans isomerase-like 4
MFVSCRIKHTVILDDPFDDPPGLIAPDTSPPPSDEMIKEFRVGDEDLKRDDSVDEKEIEKRAQMAEISARALTLEMVGDLPFAEIKPPENILFVCKLNPLTRDEDLEIIFGRFGKILSCQVIRDKITNESLCYAFIEYENQEDCEDVRVFGGVSASNML